MIARSLPLLVLFLTTLLHPIISKDLGNVGVAQTPAPSELGPSESSPPPRQNKPTLEDKLLERLERELQGNSPKEGLPSPAPTQEESRDNSPDSKSIPKPSTPTDSNTKKATNQQATTKQATDPSNTSPNNGNHSATPEPLEKQAQSILLKMEQVRDRLASSQLGRERIGGATQQLQQETIAELDRFLTALEQLPNTPENQNQNSQSAPSPMADPRQDPASQDPAQSRPPQEQHSSKQNRENPEDSTDRVDSSQENRYSAAIREARIQSSWGHLPESIKNRIRNTSRETYLPEYEELVRQYYEAISEQEP